jgi:hypothetical protein
MNWNKPTIEYLGSRDDVEKRIESLQRKIDILRKDYYNGPDTNMLEVMLVYSGEFNRLQNRYRHIIKLSKYEQVRENTGLY